jgi:hypothetical protein
MAKGNAGRGRPKGNRNKRHDLQEFLELVERQIDPVKLEKKFLSGKNPSEKIFLRFLEYRYGKPNFGEHDPAPISINVSAIPSHRVPAE